MYMKGNKGLIVVIVVLSAVILGLSAFIIYDKDLFGIKGDNETDSNNVVDNKENSNAAKELDVDSALVKNLANTVRKYKVANDSLDVIPYSENSNEVVLKNDMDDSLKGAVVLETIGFQEFNSKYILSKEESEKAAQEIYGDDYSKDNTHKINDEGVKYLKTTFESLFGYDGFSNSSGCPNIKNENGTYFMLTGCGYGNYINISEIYPISAYRDGEDIIMNAKVVFARWDANIEITTFDGLVLSTNRYNEEYPNELHKLNEETYKNISSHSASDLAGFSEMLVQYIKENSDKLNTYTYRFKKHNNSYYLYSVKKA